MRVVRHSPFALISQYLLAALLIAATTGVLWLLHNTLSIEVIALLYLLPAVLCTRLWGLGPGILASLCAFLCLNYFFIPPLFTLAVHQTQDLLVLIVFLVIAVVVNQLLGHDQESIAAATSREREATSLYELSTALAGLPDDRSIAQMLAEKIHETFQTERVEVNLSESPGVNFSIPDGSPALTLPQPDLTVPLTTARSKQGMGLIWRKDSPLSPAERRLLSTFTSQGALAIERAGLAKTENRALVLEESDRLKSALLSSVSHELRSPLATIKASISSLRGGEVDWDTEARQDLLAAIEEETDHLNQLVGNLLDMSRIETGALNPQRKWNSLAEIAGGVLKRMHQVVQQHHLVLDIPADLPLLPVDYIQMDQVFSNLISNSVKYAPPDTEIKISARLQKEQMVLVQVSNQGPHVAEEHLERIFDKFYRVTAADKVTGTGLGLSICKGIVEAHGGRIWAENTPGHFIFNFTLPATWQGNLPHYPEET